MNSISIESLLKINNKIIIDIRDSERFTEGNIPGSINIPMSELLKEPAKHLKKNQTYYFYCEFGYKTQRITRVLNQLGYNAISIEDGYYAYEMLQ